jgi:tRNA C32,U32 (ribose-2'-O)-methylase TrmJ
MHCVFATTGRPRIDDLSAPRKVVEARDAARTLSEYGARGLRSAVLFGPERNGLRTPDLDAADVLVHFPLNPVYCSLNVSQAVLLMCYEWMNAAAAVGPARSHAQSARGPVQEATRDDVRMLVDRIGSLLDRSHLRHELTLRRLQALLQRMHPTRTEVTLLHSIVRGLARGPDPSEAGRVSVLRPAAMVEDELLIVKRSAGGLH